MPQNKQLKMFKPKAVIELVLFISVFTIYCFCISGTINFWDSPEFIASSYTLQASHAPGAPLYTMFCGFILQFFSPENAALVSNVISAFFGAITVTLVFKIIYQIAINGLKEFKTFSNKTMAICSGLIGALSLAFSTSFWTAATETEVYTMSFALMCAIVYISILWFKTTNRKKAVKLLVIFFLLLGLAVGVHIILLSIIIPFAVLVIYKKYKANLKTIITGFVVGVIVFFLLYGFVIKGLLKLAASIDVYTVNQLSFDVNTGALIVVITVFALLGVIYIISKKKKQYKLSYATLFIILFLTGASSYIFPIIRSNANTLVAEKINTPNRLLNYISAQRFGVDNIPLIYGPTYNAQLDNARPFLNTKPILTFDTKTNKYVEAHDGVAHTVNYSSKFKMFFPRMYDAKNAENYAYWTTIKGENIAHKVKGEVKQFVKPTFSENISFFINYQINWLNLRYLFWNFIGKQNDHHGLGYIKDGNWVSGFNIIDKHRVGDTSVIPEYYKTNKANDTYYFLPFILGVIGLIGLIKQRGLLIYLTLLFLTLGIGITIYVNPLPSSILVRERDYIFIGSFIVFSIWIGLSLVTILNFSKKLSQKKIFSLLITGLVVLASPIQLFAKGWDNHQNGGDSFAYNFGKAYLDSCPEQAILITNGDNMTFPLLYLQEVEGYRTDVRVLNFDQLNIDNHINNLKLRKQKSLPLAFDLDKALYINGIEKLLPFQKETEDPIDLNILTQFLNSDKTLTNWNERGRHYIPGNAFQIRVDTTNTYFNSHTLKTYNAKLLPQLVWNKPKDFYGINDIVLLNIIKNNFGKRPICFANNGKKSHLFGLESNVLQKGMVSELIPIVRKSNTNNPKLVDTEASYKLLVENNNFKAFNSAKSVVKDENRTYVKDILRQNYYFLAQALLEENKIEKAKKTIDICFKLFPNDEVLYKQYAFALGRLYFRLGYNDLGNKVCKTAMDNIWKEILWLGSFNPPNPIINVRHSTRLLTMYQQMTKQIKPFNNLLAEKGETNLKYNVDKYNEWYLNNWPY